MINKNILISGLLLLSLIGFRSHAQDATITYNEGNSKARIHSLLYGYEEKSIPLDK